VASSVGVEEGVKVGVGVDVSDGVNVGVGEAGVCDCAKLVSMKEAAV